MKCSKCKVELAIKESKNVLDTSGDEVRLYRKMVMTCRNPRCPDHNKAVTEIKNKLQLSKDSE